MRLNLIIINLLLVCTTLFCSCQKDDESPVLTGIQPSELDFLPFNTIELEIPEEGTNPLLFTVTWTETKFFLDNSYNTMPIGPLSYDLQIDMEGNGYSNAVTLASSTNLYADIMVVDLNTILLKELGAKPMEAENYEMRIVTSYGAGNLDQQIVSASGLPVTITPYFPSKEIEPIYLIGDMQRTTYDNTAFMMYRNSSRAGDYVYTYTGRFDGDTRFKLSPKSELATGNFYYAGENGELLFGEAEDGDFFIENEGYYTLNINVENMTWSIESYDAGTAAVWPVLNFVGQFSEWGSVNEPDMLVSTYDPHQWSLDINLDNILYGVKFRADHSWDNRWCPAVPTDTPYGVADFNPTGHDNNIDLEGQGLGQYHVRFNDLTGHYVVMIQE